MRVRRSILSYLRFLVAATVLPFLFVVAYDYQIDLNGEIAHAVNTVQGLAETAAGSADDFVGRGHRFLAVLAKPPAPGAPSAEWCRIGPLASFRELHAEFTSFLLTDAAGNAVCVSGGVSPTGISVADRAWFREIRRGAASAVGEPVVSKISGRWIAMLAQAVRDEHGEFLGSIAVAIDLVRYQPLKAAARYPPGTVVTLLTREGTVLARSSDAAHWVGRNIRATELAAHALAVTTGEQVYTDLDGTRRLCGFSRIGDTGWVAVAGIPSEVAYAGVWERAIHEGLVIGLVTIVAVALALGIARIVARPVRAMADSARALAEGKFATRLDPAGPSEMVEVAEQFNRMLDVRAHTEFALGESRQRLQALFDHIRDGILLVDSDARHVDANPALCRLLGYSREEMLQMALWNDVPPALLPELQEVWTRFLAAGWLEGEFTCLRKDGTTVDVQYRAVAHFMPDLHLCSVRDITERHRLERERDTLLDRLTLEFERMPMGCIVTDEEFRIVGWNPAAESIFGYPRSEVVGKTPQEAVYPPALRPGIDELLQDMTQGRGTKQNVSENLTRDGRTILCEWHDTPLYDNAGTFTGMIAMVQDITLRRQAEQKLTRYAEHLRLLTRRLVEVQEDERRHLAGELHDRTGQNLTAINLHLSIIRDHLPADAAPLLARVDDAMTLVASTLEAVRDVMADLRAPVLEDYGLFAALRWYGDIFARRSGIKVDVSGAEPEPRLKRATETALFRVAQEAFNNVVKHANANHIAVTLEPGVKSARLTIVDDGTGFDQASERQAGAGWGIVSMGERVEAVGGQLEVDAAPGRGTRVVAEVPNNG